MNMSNTPRQENHHKVTKESQILHFKRYNYWWAMNSRRMKKNLRARLRWGEEVWQRSVDSACLVTWAIAEASKDPKETRLCK